MIKHFTLEYIHDEEGISVEARPNGVERNDYWVKQVAYISYIDESIHFMSHTMSFAMSQEIVHHLGDLADQHRQYLEHIANDRKLDRDKETM